jgi:peptidoglycan hydrolase-like protein with peptidoglycan-binding domain
MKIHQIVSPVLFAFILALGVGQSVVFAQSTDAMMMPAPVACFAPAANIRYGSYDVTTQNSVTSLQTYLSQQGYFSSTNIGTGHFGPLTLRAVMTFQTAHSLPSTGFVGPLTRAVISQNCGTQISTNFSATPTSGSAPLSVDFAATGLKGGGQYIIDYGDGANSGAISAINVCMGTTSNPAGCPRARATHVYNATGTYIATLQPYIGCMWSNPRCMIATVPLGTVTITVGTQQALSISGLDAPTQLHTGQIGSWTVHALTSSTTSNLHYSVVWGDEQAATTASIRAPDASTVSTSSTFTHQYQVAGTYTPVFTVSDDSGATVTTSNTIAVSSIVY